MRSYADAVCLVWFALDAFTHLVIEASYVALALGPTAAKSRSPFGAIWREYGRADKRWAGRDATVISLELLTVFVGGPASAAMVYAVLKCVADARKHLAHAMRRCARLHVPNARCRTRCAQEQAVAAPCAGAALARRGAFVRRMLEALALTGRCAARADWTLCFPFSRALLCAALRRVRHASTRASVAPG
jgi:hypothetical protein